MKAKNIIIAQSGGPSSVINNTLKGIIKTCWDYPDYFGRIYAGSHGIEGILKEELIDLSAQDPSEIDLLRTTPAAGSIGTCRYKLRDHQEKDFARILDIFRAHDIGYFFYIGGNDSQHTVLKVSEICNERDLGITAVGVPKTIDNDIGDSQFKLIDHTPGYGSVSRYWAMMVQNLNEENAGSYPADPVLVVQAMGRKIGFIPAAARLADPDRQFPLQIYLAESSVTFPEIASNVNKHLQIHGRCIVIVSEGLETGDNGIAKDAFGHTSFGSSKLTAQQALVNFLNSEGLSARGSARGQVPGTDQRHSMIYASTTDLEEAYLIGKKAVEIALNDGNGWMATILREKAMDYRIRYDKVPLEKVALSERLFPREWISENKMDVSDDFINYAQPLIGDDWVRIPLENGLQRFARLKPIIAEKKLPPYLPQAY